MLKAFSLKMLEGKRKYPLIYSWQTVKIYVTAQNTKCDSIKIGVLIRNIVHSFITKISSDFVENNLSSIYIL